MKDPTLKFYNSRNFSTIPQIKDNLSLIQEIKIVTQVLPFRVNSYVIDSLIDWNNFQEDPIFRLTFPNRNMLLPAQYERIEKLIGLSGEKKELETAIHEIRTELNPHPGDQTTLNVPFFEGQALKGIQHKYKETVLFFPEEGQYCHSYCTFCFRWPQFVGKKELLISSKELDLLTSYLKNHLEVTDLLFTGGDPLVMPTPVLKKYLAAIAHNPELSHITNIRIGTKSLTYWPQRFVTDPDADDLLRLFEEVVKAGKHLAIMAHYNHWKELEPDIALEAIQRIQNTGAVIRTQGPVLRTINNNPTDWACLWKRAVSLGIIPYYMFVERDTGTQHYFGVPLEKMWQIYQQAIQQVSGLARTVRGPVMSTSYGKVEVQGITEIHGEKLFVLKFLQARNPDWVCRPFFAAYSPTAKWISDLKPAFGETKFFFERTPP